MKKVLLLGLLVGLVGCKEKETGLEKQVINATYESCLSTLKKRLKSPSSLTVKDVLIVTSPTTAKRAYITHGNLLLNDRKDGISSIYKNSKVRFREIGVSIDYEAQNSFGVYLPQTYDCSYVYSLMLEETSPSDISLIRTKDIDVRENGANLRINVDGFSNLKIDSKIGKIVNTITTQDFENDKNILSNILIEHKRNKAS